MTNIAVWNERALPEKHLSVRREPKGRLLNPLNPCGAWPRLFSQSWGLFCLLFVRDAWSKWQGTPALGISARNYESFLLEEKESSSAKRFKSVEIRREAR